MLGAYMARRAAFTMIELSAAVAVLAALLAVAVQVLGWVGRARRELERREIALQEVGNVMERVAGHPWNQRTDAALRAIELSPEARAALPQGRLAVHVRDGGIVRQKRVIVEVDWAAGTQPVAPVRLVAWFSPPRGEAP